MKILNIVLAVLLLSGVSYAGTQETVYRCIENQAGDQWLEVGVVLNDGPGYNLLVVEHDYDTGSKTLMASERVHMTLCAGRKHCYLGNKDIVSLIFSDKSRETADFSLLQDGPGSVRLEAMTCFNDKSPITFD